MQSPENSTATAAMRPERGLFELTLLNAKASTQTFEEVCVDAVQRGIPTEVLTRLKGIWEQTQFIAGEVVAIGRIIVREIFEFIRRNPKIALGVAIGAAVAVLVGGIPLLGPLLQPIVAWLAMFYGAGVGAAMQAGNKSSSAIAAVTELAKSFFELIMRIFTSIADRFDARGQS